MLLYESGNFCICPRVFDPGLTCFDPTDHELQWSYLVAQADTSGNCWICPRAFDPGLTGFDPTDHESKHFMLETLNHVTTNLVRNILQILKSSAIF
jgi:hypothetical protein